MKREWYPEFRETLMKREKTAIPKIQKVLKDWYKEVAVNYTHTKPVEELSGLFLDDPSIAIALEMIYGKIYIYIGLWNVNKYINQKDVFSDIGDWLKANSGRVASLEALLKSSLIKQTNRDLIAKVIGNLRDDPNFMRLNERAAAKALLLEFKNLSKYQATRIVRTEATKAANRALLDSTDRLFPGRVLGKEWVATKDGRTRKAHYFADGQQVKRLAQFFVGGELLEYPGAGKKPSNNIYCRCAVIPVRL